MALSMHYLKRLRLQKAKLNMGHKVSVIYMDLFKHFGSLNYELLIAQLKCYALDQYVYLFFRTYL